MIRMKTIIFTLLFIALFLAGCQKQDVMLVDTECCSLNILKGEFNSVKYPESYYFNAYFLGVGADDYMLRIPVRLSGLIDYAQDRVYNVDVNPEKSQFVVAGVHYSLQKEQVFRKGLCQDSITLVIHTTALSETENYKMYIELSESDHFQSGIPLYQYIEVDFMKNVNTPPPFWTNNTKLSKLTYHPRKCVKFLEISKITDPEWEDPGNSIVMEYWIKVATQWFIDNEEYDENNNRIYFDE